MISVSTMARCTVASLRPPTGVVHTQHAFLYFPLLLTCLLFTVCDLVLAPPRLNSTCRHNQRSPSKAGYVHLCSVGKQGRKTDLQTQPKPRHLSTTDALRPPHLAAGQARPGTRGAAISMPPSSVLPESALHRSPSLPNVRTCVGPGPSHHHLPAPAH